MSNWYPAFELWSSDGNTLLYTFNGVNYTNAPISIKKYVEISNLRSSGAIIVNGGEAPFDLQLDFILQGSDYADLTNEIETLESTVALHTAYLLRIEKSDTASDWFEYRVKRVQSFEYPKSRRIKFQRVTAILRANAW